MPLLAKLLGALSSENQGQNNWFSLQVPNKNAFDLKDYYSNIAIFFSTISLTSATEDLLAQNTQLVELLCHIIIYEIDLLALNYSRDSSDELAALSYEIANNNYSDTPAGSILKMAFCGIVKVACFCREYLKQMGNFLRTQLSAPQYRHIVGNKLLNFLLKFSILNQAGVPLFCSEDIDSLFK